MYQIKRYLLRRFTQWTSLSESFWTLHCWIQWFSLNHRTSSCMAYSSYWAFGCIYSQFIYGSHIGVYELIMICFRLIEELLVCFMSVNVVLWQCHIEIRNPSHFSIEISIFDNASIVWHSCALNFILNVRIQLFLWLQTNWLLFPKSFIEVGL